MLSDRPYPKRIFKQAGSVPNGQGRRHSLHPYATAMPKAAALSLFVLFTGITGTTALMQTASAQTSTEHRRMGVVLSNLPPRDSEKYKYLKEVAGVMGGEALPMSGSEMWLIDAERVDSLMHVCDEQDVAIRPVHKGFNQIMSVMADSDARAASMKSTMGSGMVKSVTMMKLGDSGMVEYALGRGEKPMIGLQRGPQSSSDEIQIPISATQTITATRTTVYTTRNGCFWHGRIAGSQLPVSLMWWPGGRITGSFTYDGKDYLIRNVAGNEHAVMELDPEKMPTEHPVMPAEFRARYEEPGSGHGMMRSPVEDLQNLQDVREASEAKIPEEIAKLLESQTLTPKRPTNSTELVDISVLFAYTKKAASHYTDIHKDIALLAAEQTTQSFRNSKIGNVRVEIAGSYMTDYDESEGNLYNHLWRFADRGDGYMEEVHKIRDEKKADIAILIVDSPTGCGLATRVAAFANEAFAVVHHDCATSTFSIAHEIGHLIGARHDRSLDKSTMPFPYGHGFANSTKWRTMMAYKSSCDGCPRLPIWSSPVVEIEGEAAGDPNTNNSRVIMEQAARVAQFR
jgi:hypothetical protein